MADIPKSVSTERPTIEQVPITPERPRSDIPRRPVRRHVSFQLSRQQTTEFDHRETCHVTRPVIRSCSFQLKHRKGEKATDLDHAVTNAEKTNKKKSLADVLPELMKKFKSELACKSFIENTKKAIERKQNVELDKPNERQWMKGNEMQAFYHTWQTSDDHIKDQRTRPSTVRRINSLPRSFRLTESAEIRSKKTSKKDVSEFGMVRECCSRPRMRIPSFLDHETH